MQYNKDQIKNWLKDINQDRYWLAEKCGVAKVSVDGWFSRNKFPAKSMLIIKNLMNTATDKPALSPLTDLDDRGKMELRLDYKTQRLAEKESLRLGMELSTYCTLAVEWCCAQENIGEQLANLLAQETEANQGTAKQETANASLPSPAESPDPASDKHTTREILGILRLGTNPDAKRKSGTV